MTHIELRTTFALAAIFIFRMLGLFMILPVFVIYAEHLQYATPALMGVALGIYGLFQALMQMPLGALSDHIGRKPVITLGLVIFIIGSVIAALSHSIDGVILGRALQGAGAIGSTLIALTADLTAEKHRTKAMAILGICIGLSFSLAMILGPFLNTWIHVSGIFGLTAFLGVIGIIILFTIVPSAPAPHFDRTIEPVPTLLRSVLLNRNLLWLNAGIFFLHAILTSTFMAVPLALTKIIGLSQHQQGYFYLIILILSFIAMTPAIIAAEKHHKMNSLFPLAIGLLAAALLTLVFWHDSLWPIMISLLIFFTAFNFLEASLPSLISKIAPAGSRGTAMGVYSTFQFLGIFAGGIVGGWLLGHFTLESIFLCGALLALFWLLIMLPSFFRRPF